MSVLHDLQLDRDGAGAVVGASCSCGWSRSAASVRGDVEIALAAAAS